MMRPEDVMRLMPHATATPWTGLVVWFLVIAFALVWLLKPTRRY